MSRTRGKEDIRRFVDIYFGPLEHRTGLEFFHSKFSYEFQEWSFQ